MIGFLNIDKPCGITSHDVVSRIRRTTKVKQVGHGGTLDPLASGVLPIAVGKACRLIPYLSHEKVYLAEILLGVTTDTDDIEGKIIHQNETYIDSEEIRKTLNSFVGTIEQKPPLYSAIHVNGKRLYELARQGQVETDIPTRQVTIQSIEIIKIDFPVIQARIACSSGTYIRSVARDLGQKLNCGACLKSLVREKSGPFAIEKSISLDEYDKIIDSHKLLIKPQDVLNLTCITLDQKEMEAICNGKVVNKSISPDLLLPNTSHVSPYKVMTVYQNSFVAICQLKREESQSYRLIPEVVIGNAN